MSKVTLNNLVNLQNETSAVNTLNSNNSTIESAFDNTISRDGSSPNQMNADLDMNGNKVINTAAPTAPTDLVRYVDVPDLMDFDAAVAAAATLDTSITNATAAFAAFSGVYYGPLASDPSLDPLGNPVGIGDLYFNTTSNILKIYSGSVWQTYSPGNTTGILNPALSANTMLVDNAAGTARETKSFAEVRTLLDVPDFNSGLPWITAAQYGVTGDGSDQTTAFASLIAAVPATGGIVQLQGNILVSSIDLHGKRNIIFKGTSGNGAGAGQSTTITITTGAGVPRAIDCRDTVNVSFYNIYFNQTNAAFNGILHDYGLISGGCADYNINDCFYNVTSASAAGLSLYASAVVNVSNTTFTGKGTLVALQNVVATTYCNVISFRNCNFTPYNQYPITGSGEALLFDSCNWQAGSNDGIGRALNSNLFVAVKGISFVNCGFYDSTASGGEWVQIGLGEGLFVSGCRMGGAAPTTYGFGLGGGVTGDPGTSGVRGVSFFGNSFDTVTAAIAFAGSSVNGSYVRGVVTGGNAVVNGDLYSSISSAGSVVNLSNFLYGNAGASANHFSIYNIPTSATGLGSGSVWSNAGALTIVS